MDDLTMRYSIRNTWLRTGGTAALLLLPCMLGAQTWDPKTGGSGGGTNEWEVGVAGGYGFSHQVSVSNSTGSGTTGFQSGYAMSALFGNNTYKFVGGELRYTYRQEFLQVKSGGTTASMSGRSHAFHYDVLIHATPRDSAVRPFVALGGGVKLYEGTGAEVAYQPLSNFILLTHTTDLRPLLTAGGGVKFRLSRRALLRLDVRDYMTPYPQSVLTPFNSKAGGWIHDLSFLIGVSSTF